MKIMLIKIMLLLLIVVVEMIIIPAPTPPNVRPNVNVCYRCIYPGVFLTVRFPPKRVVPKAPNKPKTQEAKCNQDRKDGEICIRNWKPDPETPMSTRVLQPYKIRTPPVPAPACLIPSKYIISVTRPFVRHTLVQEYDAFPQANVRHSAATSVSP